MSETRLFDSSIAHIPSHDVFAVNSQFVARVSSDTAAVAQGTKEVLESHTINGLYRNSQLCAVVKSLSIRIPFGHGHERSSCSTQCNRGALDVKTRRTNNANSLGLRTVREMHDVTTQEATLCYVKHTRFY